MNLTEEDRKKLRESSRLRNNDPKRPTSAGIIEHRTQDPRSYRVVAANYRIPTEASLKNSQNNDRIQTNEFNIQYTPKYDPNMKVQSAVPNAKIPMDQLPINPEDTTANSWINMGNIEFDKLEWMTQKPEQPNPVTATSKFDKNGRVTQDQDEGHDIESLINFLDSTYMPQITYSLNVISRIAALSVVGYYDGCFSEDLYEMILHQCLLRTRNLMDMSNVTVCKTALKCFRSILCNTQVDEVMLDRLFPLLTSEPNSNLWLSDDDDQQEFGPEMKDHECIKLDIVQTLLERCNIVRKFITLLESNEIELIHHECIIDILTRLARHSLWACLLLNNRTLLDKIIDKLIASSITIENKELLPISLKAIKLMRILSQGLHEANTESDDGRQFLSNISISILDKLEIYYHIDCAESSSNIIEKDLLLKLHIESLRTLKILYTIPQLQTRIHDIITIGREVLYQDMRLVRDFSPVKPIETQVSTSWQLAAHVIDIVGYFSRLELKYTGEIMVRTVWKMVVKDAIFNWANLLVREKHIPHIDVSIAVAIGLEYVKILDDQEGQRQLTQICVDQVLTSVRDHNDNLNYIKILIRTASETSCLPKFLEDNGNQRDPKGLPSYGTLNFNTGTDFKYKINSVLDINSSIIMLSTFLKDIFQGNAVSNESVEVLINHPITNSYLTKLCNYHSLDHDYESKIQNSFLAQYEVRIGLQLMLLLMGYHFDTLLPEGSIVKTAKIQIEPFSKLCSDTISLVGLFNVSTDSYLQFKDKIFEKILLDSDLHNMICRENFKQSANQENRLDDFVGLTITNSVSVISRRHFDLLLPLYTSCYQTNRYWILDPLMQFYKSQIKEVDEGKHQKEVEWFKKNVNWRVFSGEVASASDMDVINAVLQFNYSLLLCSPHYGQLHVKSNVEEYLTILGCIFLDDDLFLHKNISQNLSSIMNLILRECISTDAGKMMKYPFTNASQVIKYMDQPLADVFNKLIEQYESASYGDYTFSNFILLFLNSRSDKYFKKMIFQEKADSFLPTLMMNPAQLQIPPELLFSEKESDDELKLLIKKARGLVRKGSIIHSYCLYHGSD